MDSTGGTFTGAVTLPSPVITGTPTGITAAHLEAGVLPSDVTGGSGLTALGTVASGNLSNSAIVYPEGHVTQFVVVNDNSTSGATATNTNNSVATSNFCTVTVPDDSYVYMEAQGGKIYMNSGTAIRRNRCRLFYTVDGSTPDATDSIINGAICGGSFNVGGTFHVSGFAGGTLQNTTGGTLTYKVTWGVYGDGFTAAWNSHADYPVIIRGIVYN
jgi:hypothetical protein